MNAAPDVIRGRADLGFVGLESPELRVYPRAVHLAEKLHAYTVPRRSLNSRVKDLPDMAILASLGPFDCVRLHEAFERTFEHRATHAVPVSVPQPPPQWRAPYERMALTDGLQWKSIDAVHAAVSAFLNPVLQRQLGTWNHETWAWESGTSAAL
jgi:hypothetical protein